MDYQSIASANGFRVEEVGESVALYAWTKGGKYSKPFATEAEAWEACVKSNDLKVQASMDDRTKEALLGSIAKWEAIVLGDGLELGTRNCPLCQLFYNNYCMDCPVKERTGQWCCDGTPYDSWSEENFSTPINESDPDDQEAARRVAQAELDFLISLLPPED